MARYNQPCKQALVVILKVTPDEIKSEWQFKKEEINERPHVSESTPCNIQTSAKASLTSLCTS
jgi:hypothetical protein